jgi:hypothetical protein
MNLIDIMRSGGATRAGPGRSHSVSMPVALDIFNRRPLKGITDYMDSEALKIGSDKRTIYSAFKFYGIR